MTSNAAETQLFATWTTDFDVRLNRETGNLELTAACVDGLYYRPRNLFARSDSGGQRHQSLIADFLSLEEASPDEAWERVAKLLGPLLTPHPIQNVVEHRLIVEPLGHWLEAQRDLSELWHTIGLLAQSSSIPLSYEKRRDIAIGRLAVAGVTSPEDIKSPAEYERLLDAHMPRVSDTDFQYHMQYINNMMSKWFRIQYPAIVPLLNPATLQAEVVVEMGIQALLLISISLARNDSGMLPARCARPGCTRIAFMKGRKLYCSDRCQKAYKTQRSRERKKEEVSNL